MKFANSSQFDFTTHSREDINAKIRKDLQYVISQVGDLAGLISVILVGGFGRGEGSIIFENGGIQPLNDYDLVLVFENGIDHEKLKKLSTQLAGDLGIRLLDLIPLCERDLKDLPPTQFNYDMKFGGMLLWGRDALDMVPEYKPSDIGYESGKKVLLNRLICALECYSEEFEERELTPDESFFAINQTCKVVFGCVESLLIQAGKYHHSYQERVRIFSDEFPKLTGLIELNDRATDFKLRPERETQYDALDFWHRTIRFFMAVLISYLSQSHSRPLNLDSVLSRKESFPGKVLARWLKNDSIKATLTNQPIERVEMALLFHTFSDFFTRKSLARTARKELKGITGKSYHRYAWEDMRREAVTAWHSLFH